jgi:branched-chain amino acid transport system permease protein
VSELALQQLLNGVVVGLGYALVAVGLSVMLRVLDAVNFAHGEMYVIAGLVTFTATRIWDVPYVVAGAVGVAVAALGGLALALLLRKVLRQDPFNVLLATFGVGLIISHLANLALVGRARSVDSPFGGLIEIGGVQLTGQRIVLAVVSVVALTGVHLMLSRSPIGRQMRAVAENHAGAEVLGVNLQRVAAVVFVLATALAGLAGVLLAPIVGVSALAGINVVIKAFVVVILGGIGSVTGAAVGGIALGVVESLGSTYLGSEWTNGFGFLLLIAVLLLRPQGLLTPRRT